MISISVNNEGFSLEESHVAEVFPDGATITTDALKQLCPEGNWQKLGFAGYITLLNALQNSGLASGLISTAETGNRLNSIYSNDPD